VLVAGRVGEAVASLLDVLGCAGELRLVHEPGPAGDAGPVRDGDQVGGLGGCFDQPANQVAD